MEYPDDIKNILLKSKEYAICVEEDGSYGTIFHISTQRYFLIELDSKTYEKFKVDMVKRGAKLIKDMKEVLIEGFRDQIVVWDEHKQDWKYVFRDEL